MTRPTEAEIRDAIAMEWTRDRPEDRERFGRSASLRDRFLELLNFDLYCGANLRLWEYDESETANTASLRQGELVDEALTGVFSTFEPLILEAMAGAYDRWSDEYPNLQRAGEPDPRFVRAEAVPA